MAHYDALWRTATYHFLQASFKEGGSFDEPQEASAPAALADKTLREMGEHSFLLQLHRSRQAVAHCLTTDDLPSVANLLSESTMLGALARRSSSSSLRYAMPCHAMPCHARLRYAMPCHAMLGYAMLCYAMPC